MRVPIPVVLLLSLFVVGGVWWSGTRKSDFLTPPTAEKLALVRAKVEASMPRADHPDEAIVVPVEVKEPDPPPPAEEPKPVIELGDLKSPPALQEYNDRGPKGAGHFIELAALLEQQGESRRALLAWERVLDTGKPDEAQTTAAIAAIKRLRPGQPDWNTDATKVLAITLQAGAGKKTAKTLTPILEETAKELNRASAGILKVTIKVTAGKDPKTSSRPAPVALWLAGPAKGARSTEVLSFTAGTAETLREEVRKTVFLIIRGYLGHGATQSPPPPLADGTPALDALNSHITRFYWWELGNQLNRPPEKKP